jgi:ubiquinone/menaquinone biosynthesis C-methylase UbiE
MTGPSAAAVKAFFDDVASDWDTMRLSYYDERVVDRMASAAGVDPSMTVADVGTGTGFVAAAMAPRVARVVGIDGSTGMLAIARSNLDALGIRNVELLEGDVTSLPLADHAVDAAFANMVLHHAEDPPSMLAEMRRVVRPGGAVAICDAVEHPYAWMREEHADVWLGFAPEQVTEWFTAIGLERVSVEALGMQ